MRMLCKGKTEPISNLCKALSVETDEYHEMDTYSILLKQSIRTILQNEEEKEILSLFTAHGTTALQEKIKGVEDFLLTSFVIVR